MVAVGMIRTAAGEGCWSNLVVIADSLSFSMPLFSISLDIYKQTLQLSRLPHDILYRDASVYGPTTYICTSLPNRKRNFVF